MYFLGWWCGSVDKGLTAKPANQQGRFSQWFLIVQVENKRFINVATSERKTNKGVQGPPSSSSEVLTQGQEIDRRKQSWFWPRRGPDHHVRYCLGSFASLSHNVVREVAGTEFSSSSCCLQDFSLPFSQHGVLGDISTFWRTVVWLGGDRTHKCLFICIPACATGEPHLFIHSFTKTSLCQACVRCLDTSKSQDQGLWYSFDGRQTNSNNNKIISMECDRC